MYTDFQVLTLTYTSAQTHLAIRKYVNIATSSRSEKASPPASESPASGCGVPRDLRDPEGFFRAFIGALKD